MLSFCNWWKNYTNRNNENIQTVRRLTSGQSPRFIEDLLQEGWLKFEIFRDDIETEEMTVDASARHGVLVAQLMAVASLNEQIHSLLNLKPANSMFVKCLPLTDLVLCNTRSVNSKHVCICMHTTYNKNTWKYQHTVALGFSIDLTHSELSMVQERTVSVRPSRNKRVMDASYVKQNRPASR